MQSLPPEIYAHILDFMRISNPKPRLARYSSISRAWRTTIERHNFRAFAITTEELDVFAKLFEGGSTQRCNALRSLTIDFLLPDPPNGVGCCDVENVPDRNADSAAFSTSVRRLFTVISDLGQWLPESSPISLIFGKAYRQFESNQPGRINERYPCLSSRHDRADVFEARARYAQFNLLESDCLATLYSVSSFEFLGDGCLADLGPAWIPTIIGRLPALDKLTIRTQDSYSSGCVERRAQRQALSKSLCGLPKNYMTELTLRIAHTVLENEDVLVHRLVEEHHWHEEPWSLVFGHFAQFPKLRKLHLLGGLVVCPRFFIIADFPGTPFRSLQEFVFEFAIETADGRWFFKRDDAAFARAKENPEYEQFWEEREEDENSDRDSVEDVRVFEEGPLRTDVVIHNRFRSVPDPELFNAFLKDAHCAVRRFPKLQRLFLSLKDNWDGGLSYPLDSRVFELWYLKAGTPHSPPNGRFAPCLTILCDAKYLDRNRLYWRTGNWTPWDDIQAAWAEVAAANSKVVFFDEKQMVKVNTYHRLRYVGEF